ncbi:hypothetical protein MLD38_034937 [Melastoma candidum]|uniref:Uncharacterized protein n=1 Tax=Melastoma candidum TaxID=119954 RepID=A0ACB9MDF8_9MYRT|nr:hypothetical protein MLD38_034937 [Melastoma candidum]
MSPVPPRGDPPPATSISVPWPDPSPPTAATRAQKPTARLAPRHISQPPTVHILPASFLPCSCDDSAPEKPPISDPRRRPQIRPAPCHLLRRTKAATPTTPPGASFRLVHGTLNGFLPLAS